MEDKIKTGNDLKEWRKEQRLTRKQLADFVDYSPSRIAHIENENKRITNRLARKLSRFDVPYCEDLVEGIDEIANRQKLKYYNYDDIKEIKDQMVALLDIDTSRMEPGKRNLYLKFLSDALKNLNEMKKLYQNTKKNNDRR